MTQDMVPKEEPWKHERRSIIRHGEDEWVGWERIMDLYKIATKLDESTGTHAHALYFTVLFETGGRRWEVILLRPNQVSWNEEAILIRRMEVLKQRKIKGRKVRNVYIKIEGDPLAPIMIDLVEDCDTKYLLPGYGEPFSKTIDPESHISSTHVYNKVCKIDGDIWPHWLRDQRSWQLSAPEEEGGRGFDAYLLKAWFEWASMDMPAHYAGRRKEKDIMKALGIIKRPTRRVE